MFAIAPSLDEMSAIHRKADGQEHRRCEGCALIERDAKTYFNAYSQTGRLPHLCKKPANQFA